MEHNKQETGETSRWLGEMPFAAREAYRLGSRLHGGQSAISSLKRRFAYSAGNEFPIQVNPPTGALAEHQATHYPVKPNYKPPEYTGSPRTHEQIAAHENQIAMQPSLERSVLMQEPLDQSSGTFKPTDFNTFTQGHVRARAHLLPPHQLHPAVKGTTRPTLPPHATPAGTQPFNYFPKIPGTAPARISNGLYPNLRVPGLASWTDRG